MPPQLSLSANNEYDRRKGHCRLTQRRPTTQLANAVGTTTMKAWTKETHKKGEEGKSKNPMLSPYLWPIAQGWLTDISLSFAKLCSIFTLESHVFIASLYYFSSLILTNQLWSITNSVNNLGVNVTVLQIQKHEYFSHFNFVIFAGFLLFLCYIRTFILFGTSNIEFVLILMYSIIF